MGDSSGSMFYMFLGVIVIYVIGVIIYSIIEKRRKKNKYK